MSQNNAMRALRCDEATINQLLDDLDKQARGGLGADGRSRERHVYRAVPILMDVIGPSGASVRYNAVSRNISPDGIALLTGSVVYPGSKCIVQLLTLNDRTHTVDGRIVRCRYLSGTRSVHEIGIRFEHPVDLALFSRTAVPANVLLAEDSVATAKLVRKLLEPLNVDLTHVENGNDVIKTAAEQTFDVILLDMEMPELDGFGAVAALRKAGYLRPVVALTALTEGDVRERCIQAGCDEFVAKPFGREALLSLLRKYKPAPLISSLLMSDNSMAPMIDDYVKHLRQVAQDLEANFAANEMAAIAKHVRALWSEAGGYGFEAIAISAEMLEAGLKTNSPNIRSKVTELVALCRAARLSSGAALG